MMQFVPREADLLHAPGNDHTVHAWQHDNHAYCVCGVCDVVPDSLRKVIYSDYIDTYKSRAAGGTGAGEIQSPEQTFLVNQAASGTHTVGVQDWSSGVASHYSHGTWGKPARFLVGIL